MQCKSFHHFTQNLVNVAYVFLSKYRRIVFGIEYYLFFYLYRCHLFSTTPFWSRVTPSYNSSAILCCSQWSNLPTKHKLSGLLTTKRFPITEEWIKLNFVRSVSGKLPKRINSRNRHLYRYCCLTHFTQDRLSPYFNYY